MIGRLFLRNRQSPLDQLEKNRADFRSGRPVAAVLCDSMWSRKVRDQSGLRRSFEERSCNIYKSGQNLSAIPARILTRILRTHKNPTHATDNRCAGPSGRSSVAEQSCSTRISRPPNLRPNSFCEADSSSSADPAKLAQDPAIPAAGSDLAIP